MSSSAIYYGVPLLIGSVGSYFVGLMFEEEVPERVPTEQTSPGLFEDKPVSGISDDQTSMFGFPSTRPAATDISIDAPMSTTSSNYTPVSQMANTSPSTMLNINPQIQFGAPSYPAPPPAPSIFSSDPPPPPAPSIFSPTPAPPPAPSIFSSEPTPPPAPSSTPTPPPQPSIFSPTPAPPPQPSIFSSEPPPPPAPSSTPTPPPAPSSTPAPPPAPSSTSAPPPTPSIFSPTPAPPPAPSSEPAPPPQPSIFSSELTPPPTPSSTPAPPSSVSLPSSSSISQPVSLADRSTSVSNVQPVSVANQSIPVQTALISDVQQKTSFGPNDRTGCVSSVPTSEPVVESTVSNLEPDIQSADSTLFKPNDRTGCISSVGQTPEQPFLGHTLDSEVAAIPRIPDDVQPLTTGSSRYSKLRRFKTARHSRF